MRGKLETEQNCNILTFQFFWLQQHFFPVLLGCSTGSLGSPPLQGHGSHSSSFSPTDWLPIAPGLYICFTSTIFMWCHNSHSVQPVDSQSYPPISSTGCTCYLHRCISHQTDRLGWWSLCYTCSAIYLPTFIIEIFAQILSQMSLCLIYKTEGILHSHTHRTEICNL